MSSSSDIPTFMKIMTWLGSFVSIPSFVGSLLIFQHILRNKFRRKQTYHRLMSMLSLFDMLSSIGWFSGTWPMPKELSDMFYMASGTTQTCSLFGFVLQLGMSTPGMYNAALGIYFVLKICFNYSDIKIRCAEITMNVIILVITFTTSIVGLVFLQLYNPSKVLVCTIEEYPLGCSSTGSACERGNNAGLYQLWFHYVPIWLSFIINFICMALVFHSVLSIERRRSRFMFNANTNTTNNTTNHEKSKAVMWRGLHYFIAFGLTWSIPSATRIMRLLNANKTPPKYLYVLAIILTPLQGFWNFLIYFKPRYYEYKKLYPNDHFLKRICTMFRHVEQLDDNLHLHYNNIRRRRTSLTSNNNNRLLSLDGGGGGGGGGGSSSKRFALDGTGTASLGVHTNSNSHSHSGHMSTTTTGTSAYYYYNNMTTTSREGDNDNTNRSSSALSTSERNPPLPPTDNTNNTPNNEEEVQEATTRNEIKQQQQQQQQEQEQQEQDDVEEGNITLFDEIKQQQQQQQDEDDVEDVEDEDEDVIISEHWEGYINIIPKQSSIIQDSIHSSKSKSKSKSKSNSNSNSNSGHHSIDIDNIDNIDNESTDSHDSHESLSSTEIINA